MRKKWIPFEFDGNQITLLVNSQKDFQKVVDAYRGSIPFGLVEDELLLARNVPNRDPDLLLKFGFRTECCGDLTLGEWAKLNDIELLPKKSFFTRFWQIIKIIFS